jgi:tRNA pseudouridine55 synthase
MTKILNLYKPKGLTSHDLVERVRREYPGEKVGHGGSLDPIARGVLLVGIGKATKELGKLAKKDKEYHAQIVLGLSSETDDLDSGKIKGEKIPIFDRERVSGALERFRGRVEQSVPLFSATHYQGEKLYKRARRGEKVPVSQLPKKKVTIHKLKLTDFNQRGFTFGNKKYPLVELEIICSAGTYIRSLARDLGQDLDTSGILVNLIRTRVGEYKLRDSQKL